MKVIYSIKVHRDNLKTLQGLKCLQYVDVGEDGKSITCQFKDNKTRGCLIAHTKMIGLLSLLLANGRSLAMLLTNN